MSAVDTTLDRTNFQEEQDDASENSVARKLRQAKRSVKQTGQQATQQAAQEAFKKAAERLAKKAAVRTASWGAGASVVGLVVTYIIWTIQAIGGNLMGFKWIPKLDWWELILWGILGLLLLGLLIMLLAIIIAAADPVGLGLAALKDSWSALKGYVGL